MMNVTTFMYMTNIFINMCYIYPVLIISIIFSYFFKIFINSNVSTELDKLYFLKKINKFIFIAIICIFSFSFVPSREVVIFYAENIGNKMFAENNEQTMLFYDFISRVK